jgi:hypothetical protein
LVLQVVQQTETLLQQTPQAVVAAQTMVQVVLAVVASYT